MKITERDVEVLRELEGHAESLKKMGAPEEQQWARPLDIGGRDSSHHSHTLKKLERHKLVESKQRSGLTTRGSKVYRLTAVGKQTAEQCIHWQVPCVLITSDL